MRKIATLALLLLITMNGNARETKDMYAFDRKALEIEDNWSAKEIGYKDSELITLFRKNIGASEISGHPKLNNLIYLTVSYIPDNEQGFPSKEDYKKISNFEDIAVLNIELESDSIHVASVLKNGIYDFLFYVSNPDRFVESVNNNNSKIKSFRIDLELANDPKWETYHDFP
ncbi:DUF695 domain-containing protein [Shewanella submarina]|uniref:DUF695 domain-containing protein n=1 Tax=Shewanella submarina TaxID=2016376 RepID=A0ABV7GDZ1_9GAMM|nr:DUF695 domain-containing protein [Shewanella submarina]MCL1037638.1 DUF695 domain-containing protein [Shewanella submarina]